MSDKPTKKQLLDVTPEATHEFVVEWWNGAEWMPGGPRESAEEAVAASRGQNRRRQTESSGEVLYPYCRAVKTTTVQIKEVLG